MKLLVPLSSQVYFTRTDRILLPISAGETRNKAAIPALAGALKALLPKVDKVLAMCQTNENFAVGDKMTFADIYIFAIRTFTKDPLLNTYTDIKAAMPPKAATIAGNVAKHPVVAEYIKTDGDVPATGIFDIYT